MPVLSSTERRQPVSETADKTQAITPWPAIPPPSHPIWREIKAGLMALSFANLCFLTAWFSPLYDADFGYFNKLPVNNATLLSLAVNLLWFAALTWVVIRVLRRHPGAWWHLPVHVLFFLLLLLPLDFCRLSVFHITDYQIYMFLKKPAVLLGLLALFAAVVWQHRRVARVLAVVVGLLSPLAFFTLLKITLVCLGIQHIAQDSSVSSTPPLKPVHAGQPRVLWIIFDETDQRLAFEQRPAGLQLPELDRLRNESFSATNAYPPGDDTFHSMPQLILGRRASSVTIKNASDLRITLADTDEVTSWSKLPSLFTSARDMGVNTALVGWYHPYSRLLNGALNYCAWYPFPTFECVRASTFSDALIREINCLKGAVHRRQLHVDLVRASIRESQSLVTNGTYGLILLHLAMPHKPGIYLPDKDRMTVFGMSKTTGYFNNLILVDRTFGNMRRAMETSGQWDKTWVIVSTDHSWRESKLYDGKRDLRIPFLIKAPGDNKAITYSPRLNTVLTHDLILAILRGEITGQDSAVTWLDAHPRPEPTITSSSLMD